MQQASESAKGSIGEQLAMYKNSLEVMQEKLVTAVTEIKKGNTTIARMQQENEGLKEKANTKSEVIRKQEALVQELKEKLGETERHMVSARESLSHSRAETALAVKELETHRERLAESAAIITSNQQVITWLNRELSRFQLTGPMGFMGAESLYDMAGDHKKNVIPYSPDTVTAVGSHTSPGSRAYPVKSLSTEATTGSNSDNYKIGLGTLEEDLSQDKRQVMESYRYLKSIKALEGLEGLDSIEDFASDSLDVGMAARRIRSTPVPSNASSKKGGVSLIDRGAAGGIDDMGYYGELLGFSDAKMEKEKSSDRPVLRKAYDWESSVYGLAPH